MTLNIVRVHADETGETRLSTIELPEANRAEDGYGAPLRRVLANIPTTTMMLNENLERRPKVELHPAPRRQLVVLVQGEFEITTTSGDRRRFRPGDCLLADDLGTKGHVHEDVGDDFSITIAVGIPDDWHFPGT
jgi:hypothetical protein